MLFLLKCMYLDSKKKNDKETINFCNVIYEREYFVRVLENKEN